MVQKIMGLLLLGWNAAGMLKTYSMMIPHTHNLQSSGPGEVERRVKQSGDTAARLC